jgi:hypothetical protein
MKIYYEPPEQIDFVEEKFGELLKSAGFDETKLQIMAVLQPVFKFTNELYNQKQIMFFEQLKLKLMWALRSFEAEIEAETGSFTITNTGGLILNVFSDELTGKIKQRLLEIGKL